MNDDGCAGCFAEGTDRCVLCGRLRDDHRDIAEVKGELLIEVDGVGVITGDRAAEGAGVVMVLG